MARLFVEVSKNVCFVIQSATFTLIRVWLGIHLFLSMQHNKIIVIGRGVLWPLPITILESDWI